MLTLRVQNVELQAGAGLTVQLGDILLFGLTFLAKGWREGDLSPKLQAKEGNAPDTRDRYACHGREYVAVVKIASTCRKYMVACRKYSL